MPQRVVPELQADTSGAVVLSQTSATLDEPSGTVTVTAGVHRAHAFQQKVWVAEAVPPASDTSETVDVAAAARVYYYRQTEFLDDEPSAFMSFLAGLLCMPKVGSWRMRPGSRELSVDSVDFVSEWHRAQAEAALRPIVPVLKRPGEASMSVSRLAPRPSGDLLACAPQSSRLAARPNGLLPVHHQLYLQHQQDGDEAAAADAELASEEVTALTHVMSIRSPAEVTMSEEAERARTGSGSGSRSGSGSASGAGSGAGSSRAASGSPGGGYLAAPAPQSHLVQCLAELGLQGPQGQGGSVSRPASKRSVRWG